MQPSPVASYSQRGNDDSAKPSSIVSNRDFLLVAFVLNMAMVWTVGITLAVDRQDVPMLSFAWTFRLPSTDERFNMSDASEKISKMYHENTQTSAQALSNILDSSLSHAGCKHAIADGGLTWRQSEISPTCNCLRNTHIAYVTAVNPVVLGLNQSKDATERDKIDTIVASIPKKCFMWVRHTQVGIAQAPMCLL